ncbi:MAG: formyltransferase family protein [Gemmatimonadales bacterium]
MARARERLSVVVLTSIPLGIEVTAALRALPEVGQLTLFSAPAIPHQTTASLIRTTWRHEGMRGLLDAALRRARKAARLQENRSPAALAARRCPNVAHFPMAQFHSDACRARISGLAPDLGVVVGTHVLKGDLFTIPRLGCINLHLGAAPEFRGSSPGFYELLEGVPEAGVTIHRVTDTLDGGDILLQERFPLETAPDGDPVDYLRRYLAEVLCPNGVRMMAAAVAAMAHGTQTERVQDAAAARTYRRATCALKRELRQRVAERRKGTLQAPVGRLTYGSTEP